MAFIDALNDTEFAALDAAIKFVLEVRGIDLAGTEWLKPLGQGLHEFRVRHTADETAHMFSDTPPEAKPTPQDVLLRVFVHFHGQRVVLLLSGYDKGGDPSRNRQDREIKNARKCLTAWQQQELRRKAEERKRRP